MINGVGIGLDDKTAALGRKSHGSLELGIRPLYLEVHPQEVENSVPAKVKSIEDQGNYKIITTSLSGKTLRARLPEGKETVSENAWLRFPKSWIRLFANDKLLTRQQ